jgi:hypothetical protein
MKTTFTYHMKTCTHQDETDPTNCEYVTPKIYTHNEGNLRCQDYKNTKNSEEP